MTRGEESTAPCTRKWKPHFCIEKKGLSHYFINLITGEEINLSRYLTEVRIKDRVFNPSDFGFKWNEWDKYSTMARNLNFTEQMKDRILNVRTCHYLGLSPTQVGYLRVATRQTVYNFIKKYGYNSRKHILEQLDINNIKF